jgi:hypothetical protein
MVLLALTTQDTASTERGRDRFLAPLGMTKYLVPERQIHLVNERGALGRQVSKRELPEHVDVEILRAKTALRMTRTG